MNEKAGMVRASERANQPKEEMEAAGGRMNERTCLARASERANQEEKGAIRKKQTKKNG